MIDFHCHILYGIDDGSKSLEESIEILKKAYENGVTEISFSPHYILGSSYNANNDKKEKLLKEIKKELKKQNIDIKLYYGNEVFVENNMLDLLKQKEISTINNSNYLLFELPMNNKYNGINNLIFELKSKGIQPIIAHPERYLILQKDPTLITKMIDQGALFQSNIGSFYGYYGKEVQKTAFLLLKHNMISFICSDIHHSKDNFYENIDNVKKMLKKYITEEKIEDLFINNAKNVLNNKNIKKEEYIEFKKGLFGKIK